MEAYPDRCPTCRRPVTTDPTRGGGAFLCPVCGSISLLPTRIQDQVDQWVAGERQTLPDAFLNRLPPLLSKLSPQEQRVFEMRLQGHRNEEIQKQVDYKYERKVRRALQRIHRFAKNIPDIQDLFRD